VVVVGLVASGSQAATGALVGTVLTTVVLGSGLLVVEVVTKTMPALSLLVALMTYTLQLVLVLVLVAAVAETPALADAVPPAWFAAAVIACALAWTVAQVVTATRARIPAFDLPAPTPSDAPSLPPATTTKRGAR